MVDSTTRFSAGNAISCCRDTDPSERFQLLIQNQRTSACAPGGGASRWKSGRRFGYSVPRDDGSMR